MSKIYTKLFDFLEIGDDFPTILMGVLNLSPESFYKNSIFSNITSLGHAAKEMVKNGAQILDLGARSTAPWSQKISIDEEIKRIIPAMDSLCRVIPENIIISIDTQYKIVAEQTYSIASKYSKKIIINDVSCLKTDPNLEDFLIEKQLPILLMASKKIPGDCLTIQEIITEFEKTIKKLIKKGFNEKLIILDPGIGHWIKKKTPEYDLKIIHNLNKLRILKLPILVALSRKSFIGAILNNSEPENRYNGTLSATAISIFHGAHIIRTHDVNQQLLEIAKIAEEIRRNK